MGVDPLVSLLVQEDHGLPDTEEEGDPCRGEEIPMRNCGNVFLPNE